MDIDYNALYQMAVDNWALAAAGGAGSLACGGAFLWNLAISGVTKVLLADGDQWQSQAKNIALRESTKENAIEVYSRLFDERQAYQKGQLERMKWKPKKKSD